MAMAGAVGERDAPRPAGFQRGGAGVRRQRCATALAWASPGPVDRQPAAEVDEALLQRAAEQQRSETGTVDEQVARHHAAIGQLQLRDAAIGPALHVDDASLGAPHAALKRHLAQEIGIQRGVEVVGVIELRPLGIRRLEAPFPRHHAGQALLAERTQAGVIDAAVLPPQGARACQAADIAKRVEVLFACCAPVAERDAQFEGAIGGTQELRFIDAKDAVEGADGRERRLPDTDNADFFRFHQLHCAGRQRLCQCRRRHPACRTAADNNDPAKSLFHHCLPHFCRIVQVGPGSRNCENYQHAQ